MDEYVKRAEFDSLKNQVEKIESEMVENSKLLVAIDKKIDIITEKVINSDKMEELKLKPIEERVKALETKNMTLWGVVITAIVGAVLKLVIK